MSFYFAYGSNINEKQMRFRMRPRVEYGISKSGTCKLIGAAILPNYELVFDVPDDHVDGAGYANIQRSKGSFVCGAIYEVDATALRLLDIYECVPVLYKRGKIKATLIKATTSIIDGIITGTKLSAIAYVGNKKPTRKGLKPTKRYLKRILRGKLHLPKDYIKKLEKLETID